MTAADALGWIRRRRLGFGALAAGLAAALAMPSWSVWPLGIIGLAAFAVLAATADNRRAAFGRGWMFGLGFFGLGLYWIGFSFGNRDPALALLAPFAIAALAGGLGLFTGLVGIGVRGIRARPWLFPLGFAGVWTLGEIARGVLFTGFPWNLAAHAVAPGSVLSQAAAYVGVYGLSFLCAAFCAACALPAMRGRAGALPGGAFAAAVAIAAFALGLSRPDAPPADGEAPVIRVVQPNIAQLDKWKRELRGAHFANLLDLSSAPAAGPVALIVWPETSTPFDLSTDPDSRALIAERALDPGAAALIGAPRRDADGRIRNSVVAFGPDAAQRIYDKHHLVPFGEYVPFGEWLPFGGLAGGGFAEGPGPALVEAAGLRVAILICYEVIFPRYAGAAGRPDLMINVTNDAWFDDSPGPRQHAVAAAYRAIEQGVPLVRSANTGVSLVTDARGATLKALDFGRRGVVDVRRPAAFPQPPLIAAAPLAIPFGLALLGAAAAAIGRIRPE